jgi:GWxTD domain-containing protein
MLGIWFGCWIALAFFPAGAQDRKKSEAKDHFEKWIKEDVRYLITPEEKDVFSKLQAAEEKESFIEQFWLRRDPDPSTPTNEFREEHYRRIAYANERFAEGTPGWLTDRGRIYIIHGQPDRIESHDAGEVAYERRPEEGGGTTATFPFLRWWYRHIDGIGDDIELEFVDKRFSGAYSLVTDSFEKDALMHTNFAPTDAELAGVAERVERFRYTPQRAGNLLNYREKDNPFEKYRQLAKLEAPRPLKYRDLEKVVRVNITYALTPVKVRMDYVRLDEGRVLVPITVQVANKDLEFKNQGSVYAARMAAYGKITNLAGRVVTEFEQDIMTSYPPHSFEKGLSEVSLYQKIVTLDAGMRYKLDLVIKDLQSGKLGLAEKAVAPPRYGPEKLQASSLILSNSLKTLDMPPEAEQMFVLGDVRIHPKIDNAFPKTRPLGVYLQLYNVALDPVRNEPSLQVQYRVLQGVRAVGEVVDDSGASIQFVSPLRVVLVQVLRLDRLAPGRYTLDVEATDRISGQRVTARDSFQVIDPEPATLTRP